MAYLHSAASTPIIHRDVKSSNILLGDSCTAKVADLGASNLMLPDHDGLPSLVKGTLGYLDPGYLHTSQFTDRSDVYSFGVVLVELPTGEEPIMVGKSSEKRNLARHFHFLLEPEPVPRGVGGPHDGRGLARASHDDH